MKKINRILALCNDYEKCDDLLKKTSEISKEHNAGVTLMFVTPEAMFELPFFSKEDSLDHQELRRKLLKKAKTVGLDNPAVLIYENDTADRAAVEAEKENDTLIIMPYEDKITLSVVKKVNIPILILKESVLHEYSSCVVTVDAAIREDCLNFLRTLFKGMEIELFQDFLYFPLPVADAAIEPFDISSDGIEYAELLKMRKEAFYRFCEETGIKGTFIVGENGIDEDIVSFVKQKRAELLVINAMDKGTILADSIGDILSKNGGDILVCFENR